MLESVQERENRNGEVWENIKYRYGEIKITGMG